MDENSSDTHLEAPYKITLLMSDQEWLAEGESQERVLRHLLEKRRIATKVQKMNLPVGKYLWVASRKDLIRTAMDAKDVEADLLHAHVMDVVVERIRYQTLLDAMAKSSSTPNENNKGLSFIDCLQSALDRSKMNSTTTYSSFSRKILIIEVIPKDPEFDNQLVQFGNSNPDWEIQATPTPKESLKILKKISKYFQASLADGSLSFRNNQTYENLVTQMAPSTAENSSSNGRKSIVSSDQGSEEDVLPGNAEEDESSETQKKLNLPAPSSETHRQCGTVTPNASKCSDVLGSLSLQLSFDFETLRNQYERHSVTIRDANSFLGLILSAETFETKNQYMGDFLAPMTQVSVVNPNSLAECHGIRPGDWVFLGRADEQHLTPIYFNKEDMSWAKTRPLSIVLLRTKSIPNHSATEISHTTSSTHSEVSGPADPTVHTHGAKAYITKFLSQHGLGYEPNECWSCIKQQYPQFHLLVDGIESDSNHTVIKIGVALSRMGMKIEDSRALAKAFVKGYKEDSWSINVDEDDIVNSSIRDEDPVEPNSPSKVADTIEHAVHQSTEKEPTNQDSESTARGISSTCIEGIPKADGVAKKPYVEIMERSSGSPESSTKNSDGTVGVSDSSSKLPENIRVSKVQEPQSQNSGSSSVPSLEGFSSGDLSERLLEMKNDSKIQFNVLLTNIADISSEIAATRKGMSTDSQEQKERIDILEAKVENMQMEQERQTALLQNIMELLSSKKAHESSSSQTSTTPAGRPKLTIPSLSKRGSSATTSSETKKRRKLNPFAD